MTAVDDKQVTREQSPRVAEPTPHEVRPTAAPAPPPERGWIVPLAVLIVASVAVAVFGGLNIAAVAQMTSDRGAMVTGVAPDQLYVTAWLCAGAALLAVTMRSGRRAAGGESVVVEV